MDQNGPEGKNSLLVPNAGALQHEEVLLDLSVVREATHGSDGLVSKVVTEHEQILLKLISILIYYFN